MTKIKVAVLVAAVFSLGNFAAAQEKSGDASFGEKLARGGADIVGDSHKFAKGRTESQSMLVQNVTVPIGFAEATMRYETAKPAILSFEKHDTYMLVASVHNGGAYVTPSGQEDGTLVLETDKGSNQQYIRPGELGLHNHSRGDRIGYAGRLPVLYTPFHPTFFRYTLQNDKDMHTMSWDYRCKEMAAGKTADGASKAIICAVSLDKGASPELAAAFSNLAGQDGVSTAVETGDISEYQVFFQKK